MQSSSFSQQTGPGNQSMGPMGSAAGITYSRVAIAYCDKVGWYGVVLESTPYMGGDHDNFYHDEDLFRVSEVIAGVREQSHNRRK